jgi:hypothetical protein
MAAPEKEQRSMLGLGTSAGNDDPSGWRPSKAARSQEQDIRLDSRAETESRTASSAWRPSKVAEERLGSLSSRQVRRRFAMPRGLRPLLTLVFFAAAAYCFLKLWLTPQAGQLHPELAVAAGMLILLVALVFAGAIARRRRKRGDEKSTLRL